MRTQAAVLVAGLVLLPTSTPASHVPTQITVQGKLTDVSGTPLPAGAKTFTFRIYDDPVLGVKIWPIIITGEVQTVTTGSDGLWIALVGGLTPLSDAVFADSARWLEITVDDGQHAPEVLPRIRIANGPFAFRVGTVDGATGGEITGSVSIGLNNTYSGNDVFVAGTSNEVNGDGCAVAGGLDNTATGALNFVGSGTQNTTEAQRSAIVGGLLNHTRNFDAFVGAGIRNEANGAQAAIAGGRQNVADGFSSFIGAGDTNSAGGEAAAVVAGRNNQANGLRTFIGGGEDNIASGDWNVISGGRGNTANGTAGFIGSGEANTTESSRSAIVGGAWNHAGWADAFVGAGQNNAADGNKAAVVGGLYNSALGNESFIGGGFSNQASDSGAAVVAGRRNHASGLRSYIGGGEYDTARGDWSAISGGAGNMSSGDYSVVAGGQDNRASGQSSFVAGGSYNVAVGHVSFAAGHRAHANHVGSFVWGDYQAIDVASDADHQFKIRAANGVRFASAAGNDKIIDLGDHYRDNGIVAWARVTAAGTTGLSEFGVSSSVKNSTGNYTVTVDITAGGSTYLVATATAEVNAAPTTAATIRIVSIHQTSPNSFGVYVNDGNGALVDNDFVFIATAR